MTDVLECRRRRPTRSLAIPGLLTLALCLALGLARPALAIGFGAFGPGGSGGSLNGQSLSFGADGAVFELDAYLYTGTGPALSLSDLVSGGSHPLGIQFGATLSADGSDLLLTYDIANLDVSPLTGFTFVSFLDAEIAESTTSYFNEVAQVIGAAAPGQGFEIDEPGYVFGDILDNVLAGALDGANAVGPGAPDDVSMALSFSIGSLDPGDLARIQILLSEDGDGLGPLRLVQSDPLAPGTVLTYSGQSRIVRASAPIPEPSGALLFGLGAAVVLTGSRRGRRARRLLPHALLGLALVGALPAVPGHARVFFTPGDPALQGASVIPLDASSGFANGQLQHSVSAGGQVFDFQTTHAQGMFGTVFLGIPALAARFPDGVIVDIAPPAGAVGLHFLVAECNTTIHFDGVAATESFSTQPGDGDLFIGAADIGDISRVRIEAGCFAAAYDELRAVGGGTTAPTDEADLRLFKSSAVTRASQADGSVVWDLSVDNAGPDPSDGARTIDFLPLGTNVVSSNPFHAILAGTRLAQQGVGTLAPGATFPLTLETDIPPFYSDPNVASIFACNSAMTNVALTTATSIDPDPSDNLSTHTVRFDAASRAGFPEICDNGQDDDCNGLVDCSESSCANHPHCRPPLLPGSQQPTCLFGCAFPPAPPPPAQACTANDVHGRPVAIPGHCCALNGPRVNGRAPQECMVTRDPNFKTVDPPVDAMGFGVTTAGRLHDYAITYENIGTGDAFDVSVVDVLDPDLDDATLMVGDDGVYDPATRTIVWNDPLPLPPFTPRTVGFQVEVRSDAPFFTAVRNQATVVFPTSSPPEFTDTNVVEHLIVPPGGFVVDPGVVGCQETSPGSGEWTVSLFNKGDAFGWNAGAEIVNPPASVDVGQGQVDFGALDDFAGAPDRSITARNTTPSLGTVRFTTQTPGDPCRTLTWRISWEDVPGDPPQQRDVQVDPDADRDGVADAEDRCPDTYDPDQADADGDGIGDACEPVVVLLPIDDLMARAKSGKVDLVWTPPAGASSYDVYRSDAGGPSQLVAAGHVAPFGVYADAGLVDGTTYTYQVVWRDAAGDASPPSNPASATPQGRSRGAVPPGACGSVGGEQAGGMLLALCGRRLWKRRRRRSDGL